MSAEGVLALAASMPSTGGPVDASLPALAAAFSRLSLSGFLRGLSADRFAEGAAAHLGCVARAGPSRGGAGSLLAAHARKLASQAGHEVDAAALEGADWDRAWRLGADGDSDRLCRLLQGALGPCERISVEDALDRLACLRPLAQPEVHARLLAASLGGGLARLGDAGLSQEYLAVCGPDDGAMLARVREARALGVSLLRALLRGGESPADEAYAIHQAAIRAVLSALGQSRLAAPAVRVAPGGAAAVPLRVPALLGGIGADGLAGLSEWAKSRKAR